MKKYLKNVILIGSLFLVGCTSLVERKEEASIIIKNGTVLTMNEGRDILENGVVVIKDNKIISVGNEDLLERYSAKKIIDAEDGIVMPGMINTHTHVAMTVFRSLADDVPDRLNRYIFPLENKMVSPEMAYLGARLGTMEMALGGVTTMVDMYLFEESAAEAVKEIGLRGIMTQNIIKYPTADGKNKGETLNRAIALIEKYQNDELITPGLAPHAPHTVTKEELLEIKRVSEKYNAPVSMHVAETDKEFAKFKKEFNMTPVEYLDSLGLLNERLIAAHNIFVTDSDIELLKKRDVGLAHNMVANIKSAKGISPALKMHDEGLRVGLGTDGPMSGNTLDIIGQLGYVAKVHKLNSKDRSALPPKKAVEMATIGGAKAIHREQELGSLEAGKLADVVIVETKSVNMNPIYDPYSALVYSANASNVDTVIVNGKLIVEDREIKTIDSKKVIKEMTEFKKKVEEVAKTL
ncbi:MULTISPECIES: amidohydrolase [unclassified Fusobacterium]|uniref:amidohydrolase n=1 Tax=unclassified Fusobacterium TaxID=2648384 RepID=UPI00262D86FB|nr:amidohydrolase [Fusobacterium sp.]